MFSTQTERNCRGQTPKLTFHKKKTHALILYEPLAQRAIGPLDRGEIITNTTGTLSNGQRAGD